MVTFPTSPLLIGYETRNSTRTLANPNRGHSHNFGAHLNILDTARVKILVLIYITGIKVPVTMLTIEPTRMIYHNLST